MSRTLLAILLAITLTACGQSATAAGGVGVTYVSTASGATAEPGFITGITPDQGTPVTYVAPTSTPISPLPGGLGPTELKYRVLTEFPDLFFCDPDYYPIARADETDLARQRFLEQQANPEEFTTILAHNNLTGVTTFSDDQKLLIYREHKKLAAVFFDVTAAGYQFRIQVARTEGNGELVSGVIDGQGAITVQKREQSIATCPICLAADTLIDTPDGPVRVQDLRVGMRVWTFNKAGLRVAEPLIQVSKTVVLASHQVVHVVLDDGRSLWVSPGHPTADGRAVGQLKVRDSLDRAIIVSVELVHYTGVVTYDILPDGSTGFYWANGILIGSTLKAIIQR